MLFGECLVSGFPSTHCYSLQDLNPEMTLDLYQTDIHIIIWDLLMCCNDRVNKLVGWRKQFISCKNGLPWFKTCRYVSTKCVIKL